MTEGAGSLKLDAAAVLDKAEMADFWLIRSFGPMTLAGLKESNPLNGHFKAVGDGGVYVCDTSVSPLFDEFPFHPERLLRDYAIIFHPALFPGERLRYFNQLK
jgi:iron complex transport system substrate-binding protein